MHIQKQIFQQDILTLNYKRKYTGVSPGFYSLFELYSNLK